MATIQKPENRYFPGGAVVKNSPANAGDTGSIPGWENPTSRRATKPVRHNYWAWALEPAHLEPVLRNEKPPQWEACAPQWEARAPQQSIQEPMQPKKKLNKFI